MRNVMWCRMAVGCEELCDSYVPLVHPLRTCSKFRSIRGSAEPDRGGGAIVWKAHFTAKNGSFAKVQASPPERTIQRACKGFPKRPQPGTAPCDVAA